ncbi:MAG: pantoate--beta-alanine ligase [Rhodanobacteraceae bacterium]
MRQFETVAGLREFIAGERRAARRVGFVPTMGNLHAGHFSLIEEARRRADTVVASIFVNPTQFGAGEDFARYPRTPELDAQRLERNGCDALFLPSFAELYPHGVDGDIRIHVPVLGEILEGASRPGHFDAVATIVAKLFLCVQPDLAVFGRKDYQQLLVVRQMVSDLLFPIEIIGAPTRREPDGLAMSSRNQYLEARHRKKAAAIYASLKWIRSKLAEGHPNFGQIEAQAGKRLIDFGLEPDYVAIRRRRDLHMPEQEMNGDLVALIAARIGGVRLIDNLDLESQ